MSVRSLILAAALAAIPALAAAQVEVSGAVARVASPLAQTAAVYFEVRNGSDAADRLVRVEGTVADRVEIHTTEMTAEGVMRMNELAEGIALAPGDSHALRPGGDHVMLMGLTGPLEQGATFDLVLQFEAQGPVTVTVTVDNAAATALAEGAMEAEGGHGAGHGDGHGDGHGASHGDD
jgi:copper(I)-binding protein